MREQEEKKPNISHPSVQALLKSQVEYFGEADSLFNDLVTTNPSCTINQEEEYQNKIDQNLSIIKSLSIVTDENFKPVPL